MSPEEILKKANKIIKDTVEVVEDAVNKATSGVTSNTSSGQEPTLASEVVFDKFDMVVSMTQATLNRELLKLLRTNTIKSTLIIYREPVSESENYNYTVCDSFHDVPPDVEYLNTNIRPQVEINNTGVSILFKLDMLTGDFAYWKGNGIHATLEKVSINNWSYAFSVRMDLFRLSGELESNGLDVPELVKNQLEAFSTNMFAINALVLDFGSTDLLDFDSGKTTVGNEDEAIKPEIAGFMQTYFNWLLRTGNPYVLGYAVNQTPQTVVPTQDQVPPSITPVGTTYTMYKDGSNPDKSNLNYCIVTKGGYGQITQSPPTFNRNWFGSSENASTKMIISSSNLVEELILRPLYHGLKNDVYNQIKGQVSVSKGNSYNDGKIKTGTGFSFVIANDRSGKDQYENRFDVSFKNNALGTKILITNGYIYCYKKQTKDMGFCTASATASSYVKWSGVIDIKTTSNGGITITQSTIINDKGSSGPSKNDCAKTFDFIGDIFGPLLFGPLLDLLFFDKLIDDVLGVSVSGIGGLDQAFNNLSSSTSTAILLPSGEAFDFRIPAIDKDGNFYLK